MSYYKYAKRLCWSQIVKKFGMQLMLTQESLEVLIWPVAYEFMDNNYEWTRDLIKELVNIGALEIVQPSGNLEDVIYHIVNPNLEELISLN